MPCHLSWVSLIFRVTYQALTLIAIVLDVVILSVVAPLQPLTEWSIECVRYIRSQTQGSGVVFTALHFLRNLLMGPISRTVCPDKTFQPSIMLQSSLWGHELTLWEQPRKLLLLGRLLALQTRMITGLKQLTVLNTPACNRKDFIPTVYVR
jgi:hypothetical protein